MRTLTYIKMWEPIGHYVKNELQRGKSADRSPIRWWPAKSRWEVIGDTYRVTMVVEADVGQILKTEHLLAPWQLNWHIMPMCNCKFSSNDIPGTTFFSSNTFGLSVKEQALFKYLIFADRISLYCSLLSLIVFFTQQIPLFCSTIKLWCSFFESLFS